MTDATHKADWFEQGVYAQTNSRIRTLKTSLPESAVRTLAQEVLHRLAQQAPQKTVIANATYHVTIEKLSRALMSKDHEAAAQMIFQIKEDGTSPEDIYLTYLADAARLLGEWWEDSRVSFVDVAIGSSRIYSIIRGMSHLFLTDDPLHYRSAVFVSVPGETHTLGVNMAADLFRKKGWEIELLVGLSHEELVSELTLSKPRLVGLSSSGLHSSVALAKLIIALRLSNPGALIMVSGQVVNEAEDVVLAMDVDGIANDVPSALATLNSLWDRSVARTSNSRRALPGL